MPATKQPETLEKWAVRWVKANDFDKKGVEFNAFIANLEAQRKLDLIHLACQYLFDKGILRLRGGRVFAKS